MDDPLPGFRFYPTEEELVSFYLLHKLHSTRPDINRVIPVVDIYDYNPWDLPEFAGDVCGRDNEQWFFFIPRQEREARGGRPNRLTTAGYWKATGTPGEIYSSRNNTVIGRKRTMVYYTGRAPNGTKTVWKMNEYKAIQSTAASSSSTTIAPNSQVREELSLCRIYKRSRTLRAFDRRPVSGAPPPPPANPQHQGDYTGCTAGTAVGAAAGNIQHWYDHPMAAVDQVTDRGSVDSSSPGHNATLNPSPENENTPGDTETWWDSDQFNWFEL